MELGDADYSTIVWLGLLPSMLAGDSVQLSVVMNEVSA